MALKEKDFIVAIELGSSKISGVAGKKNVDGSMQILAFASEKVDSCIRHGAVFNIDKTKQVIENIIKILEGRLGTKIVQVYTGIAGLSLRSFLAHETKDLLTQTSINDAIVDAMRSDSGTVPMAGYEPLDNIPQEYKIDSNFVDEPVGVIGKKIEGTYLNVLAKRTLRENLQNCVSSAGLHLIESESVAAFHLGAHLLTDVERSSGCALVDLGAETTTVVVYYKNIIRYVVVIPLGSKNITKDIAYEQIEEKEAEEIKLKYGDACPSEDEEQNVDTVITTSAGQQFKVSHIQNIIRARLQEIIENVQLQINKSGYSDKLLRGMVVTGGGSNLTHIREAFEKTNKKVRIAKSLETPSFKVNSGVRITLDDASNNTLLAILADGTEFCGGEPFDGTLFGNTEAQDNKEKIANELKEKDEAEVKANNALNGFKDFFRSQIAIIDKANSRMEDNIKDKTIRSESEKLYRDSVVPEGYDECVATLQKNDKYKQTLKEAENLMDVFKESKSKLASTITKSKKKTSFLGRMSDFVNEFMDDSKE